MERAGSRLAKQKYPSFEPFLTFFFFHNLGLTSAPFILNAFVGAMISAGILGDDGGGWRWGCTCLICSHLLTLNAFFLQDGMFAILVPVALAPLIVTLAWAERKAYKEGK